MELLHIIVILLESLSLLLNLYVLLKYPDELLASSVVSVSGYRDQVLEFNTPTVPS